MPGIVVGFDGTASHHPALDWALREAAVRHDPLTVLTVNAVPASPWTGNPVTLPVDEDAVLTLRQAAEEAVAKAASQLDDLELPAVTVSAVNGFPAKELISASSQADLLVVGGRGGGGFADLLLGSTSSQVAHHAHCPVVIVRSAR